MKPLCLCHFMSFFFPPSSFFPPYFPFVRKDMFKVFGMRFLHPHVSVRCFAADFHSTRFSKPTPSPTSPKTITCPRTSWFKKTQLWSRLCQKLKGKKQNCLIYRSAYFVNILSEKNLCIYENFKIMF